MSDAPGLSPPPMDPPAEGLPRRPRARGVARAAKVTLIVAGVLALLGTVSCATAFSGGAGDGIGAALVGLFLLMGAGAIALLGAVLAIVAVATRRSTDPVTGAPLADPGGVFPHARALTLWTGALITASGLLTAVQLLFASQSGAPAWSIFAVALGSSGGLVGLAVLALCITLIVLGSQGRIPRGISAAAAIFLALRIGGFVLGLVLASLGPILVGLAFALVDVAIGVYLLLEGRALNRRSRAPPP